MKWTLGIDLGGTGIKMALVNAQGKLLRPNKFSTPSKKDASEVVEMIVQHAKPLLASVPRNQIKGIGVGAAGDIDPVRGVVRLSPNLNWREIPLKNLLKKYLSQPIIIDNDANAAAWAAYVVEAKRKVSNLLCVTVGTGIGGGIVLNGQLYRGATGSAGEIGHMTLYPEGVRCACGNQGCVERYVGARAMAAETQRAIEAGEKTVITKMVDNDLSKVTPYIIQKAARQGDPLALHVWDEAGQRLGITLSALINVLNPHWIVLAGGLSRAGSLLLDPLKRTIRTRSFATPAGAAKIIISKLDQDLGIVGAGLLAH